MSRFSRQTMLNGFGAEGQEKLSKARVFIVGAGGLSCPALLHLAAAGVGTIGIADGDTISESNLNRQTLYGQQHIGLPKAATAATILKEKYPDITFNIFPEFLNPQNILEQISSYDLVLDGSDNFGTRYMVNDACVLSNKPLVFGAIYQYEGQVSVFNFGKDPVSYRDLYPDPPQGDQIPNCSETGVLGVLPGTIGTMQATEAIKILSGMGKVLTNKVLFYNLKDADFYEVAIKPNPASREKLPVSEEIFRNTDYNISCGTAESISWEKALDWNKNMSGSILIDIRALDEKPISERDKFTKIPMENIEKHPEQLIPFENIILFCRSGSRSEALSRKLKQRFPEKKIFSVEGGLLHPTPPFNSEKA